MNTQPFAAPSCVIPGTVAENAVFLAGKVAEVGLCFFETQPCLAYGVDDLPMHLQDLPLTWHVHLPVDMPWEAGGRAAAAIALALMGKVRYIKPWAAVLHPPHGPQAAQLISDFAQFWHEHSSAQLLLENIDTAPLVDMEACISQTGCGICLDVGHALGYGQGALLESATLLAKVALLHWSAPGQKDQHLPLSAFTPEEHEIIKQLVPRIPVQAHHMLEIFHWSGVEASAPLLQKILHGDL